MFSRLFDFSFIKWITEVEHTEGEELMEDGMEFLILYGEFLWNRNFMVSDLIENFEERSRN